MSSQFIIGFYNLENLFDTVDDPLTLDDDFTKDSEKNWNEKRFRKKIKKLGRVISNIGYNDIKHPPVLLGVAEVENEFVLQELIASKFLKKKNYQYVHYDSPDERGIDTALLYRSEYFNVISSTPHTVYIESEPGIRDFTRDILHIKGKLQTEIVHILINHWPSRRAGAEETSYKRVAAAEKNRELIDSIISDEPNAKIIIMGDFNDDPSSKSIKTLVAEQLYNPMEMLLTKYEGSLNHKGGWNLFDQIMISQNFLQMHNNDFRFEKASIFNPVELQEFKGRYKGNPFRTYVGKKYLGGFSDHFPVYAQFSINSL